MYFGRDSKEQLKNAFELNRKKRKFPWLEITGEWGEE